MASILVVSGPNEGDYYPLGHRTMVIGRDEACPIQIVDATASRKHAQLRCDTSDESYHALDLKSANGVFINDCKIAEDTPLADGDVIRIGHSELMFSAMSFPDQESAFAHYRQQGERGKSTVIT